MQAQYGLDLADAETLDRITFRKLKVLVRGLGSDSSLMHELRRRRASGDTVADQVIETEAEADQFWRRRAGRAVAGGTH